MRQTFSTKDFFLEMKCFKWQLKCKHTYMYFLIQLETNMDIIYKFEV